MEDGEVRMDIDVEVGKKMLLNKEFTIRKQDGTYTDIEWYNSKDIGNGKMTVFGRVVVVKKE